MLRSQVHRLRGRRSSRATISTGCCRVRAVADERAADLATALGHRTLTAIDLGAYAEAEQFAREGVALAQSRLGARDPQGVASAVLLALAYRYTKKFDLALDSGERAYRQAGAVYGERAAAPAGDGGALRLCACARRHRRPGARHRDAGGRGHRRARVVRPEEPAGRHPGAEPRRLSDRPGRAGARGCQRRRSAGDHRRQRRTRFDELRADGAHARDDAPRAAQRAGRVGRGDAVGGPPGQAGRRGHEARSRRARRWRWR